MITCDKCKTQFRADYTQGYPGHCDPPTSLLAYSILFLVVGLICIGIGIFILRLVMFSVALAFAGGALMSLTSIPEARRVCERSGGGVCPACGTQSPVTWRS
jgi:hypothetical protein